MASYATAEGSAARAVRDCRSSRRGRNGEVYRARDDRLNRDVAIKILPASFATNPQLKGRFEREAKTISQLNHPNICTVYDVPITICAINRLKGGAWGSDGNIVFSEGPPHGLFRVPALGGTPTEITKTDIGSASDRQDAHEEPSFLPGERSVVFGVWSAGSQPEHRVAAADLATRKMRILFGGARPLYSSGMIVYSSPTDHRTLIAAPFDPESLEVKGEPTIIATDASAEDLGGGTFAYRSQVSPPSRLEWTAMDGTRTAIPMEPKQTRGVAISPDGRRAALSIWNGSYKYDIWVVDLERGTASPVTSYGGWNRYPVWSPDGMSIVFASDRAGPPNLYRVSLDGGTPERLTSAFAIESPCCFTPDGSRLIFARVAVAEGGVGWGKSDLETLDLASHEVEPLLASDAGETSAALSPDGAWLAYTSDESGLEELYLRSFPGLAGKTRVSTDGAVERPRWSPDGRTIYFRNREQKLVGVSVGRDGALGEPRTLPAVHAVNAFDIAPDGRLLVAEAEGETREGIVAVLNWTKILAGK